MLTKVASRKQAQRAYPKLKRCERCGITKVKLNRHHANYQHALSVEVLCTTCHVKADQEIRQRPIRKVKTCSVCGIAFSAYTHSRVKTCGKRCLTEMGRRNAFKRWHPELTDLEDSGMLSCPKSSSGSGDEL